MMEIVIGIAIGVVLWRLRASFYLQSENFNTKVELAVKDGQVDLQEDYQTLIQRVEDTKKSNNGKWYDMNDVNASMKSTEVKSK